MRALVLALLLVAPSASAETLAAARTIRASTVISASDLAWDETAVAGALSDLSQVIGQEARVAIYAGRPIRPGDIAPPALVERNQLVPLIYQRGTLSIVTEGRALGRGAAGEALQVMNLGSRTTVIGTVGPDGSIRVAQGAQSLKE